jgi:hypothetical protein
VKYEFEFLWIYSYYHILCFSIHHRYCNLIRSHKFHIEWIPLWLEYGNVVQFSLNLINIPRVFFPQGICLVMNDFDGIWVCIPGYFSNITIWFSWIYHECSFLKASALSWMTLMEYEFVFLGFSNITIWFSCFSYFYSNQYTQSVLSSKHLPCHEWLWWNMSLYSLEFQQYHYMVLLFIHKILWF